MSAHVGCRHFKVNITS